MDTGAGNEQLYLGRGEQGGKTRIRWLPGSDRIWIAVRTIYIRKISVINVPILYQTVSILRVGKDGRRVVYYLTRPG